jgi:hypothetical protein
MPTPTVVNLVGVRYVEDDLVTDKFVNVATIKGDGDSYYLLADSNDKNILVNVISTLKPFDVLEPSNDQKEQTIEKANYYNRIPYIAIVVLNTDSSLVKQIEWVKL